MLCIYVCVDPKKLKLNLKLWVELVHRPLKSTKVIVVNEKNGLILKVAVFQTSWDLGPKGKQTWQAGRSTYHGRLKSVEVITVVYRCNYYLCHSNIHLYHCNCNCNYVVAT